MSVEQVAVGVAAAVVALWPQVWAAASAVLKGIRRPSPLVPIVPFTPAQAGAVTFESAVHNLAIVRSRLLSTSLLADEQKKAIDTLTLALVAGSDK